MAKDKENIIRKEKFGISAAIILIIVVSWSFFTYYVRPSQIIDHLGLSNSYLILFIGGIIGGVSLFFPFPNYLLVFTFGAAGLNPLMLGFVAGLGTIIGECTSYFFGHSAHSLLPKSTDKLIHFTKKWLMRGPKWFAPACFFVWGALFPLPNDFLLVPFGILRYPFFRIIIPLGLGNIGFNIVMAFAGHYMG